MAVWFCDDDIGEGVFADGRGIEIVGFGVGAVFEDVDVHPGAALGGDVVGFLVFFVEPVSDEFGIGLGGFGGGKGALGRGDTGGEGEAESRGESK